MGQQLYFDNYSAVGDILVLAICILMTILIVTSLASRTKAFGIFINMIVYLALAALSNLILHDWYTRITDGNYTPIYVLRFLFHAFLFSLFLLFIVYMVNALELAKISRVHVMTLSSAIYLIVLFTDIITSVRGMGFRLNGDGSAISGINIFKFGYVAFICVIAFLVVSYRKKIYKNAVIGVTGTMILSFVILFNQGRHGQTSFTVATFLFPVISVMFLLHSNPFDIKTGTVNASATASVDTAWPKPENACANPVAKPRLLPGHQLASDASPGVQDMD